MLLSHSGRLNFQRRSSSIFVNRRSCSAKGSERFGWREKRGLLSWRAEMGSGGDGMREPGSDDEAGYCGC